MADLVQIVQHVLAAAQVGDFDQAWARLAPLLARQSREREAAGALLVLVNDVDFPVDRRRQIVRAVFDAHRDDHALLVEVASALARAFELGFLNAAPPDDPLFREVAALLEARLASAQGDDARAELAASLAAVARFLGRAWDEQAERAHRTVLALRGERWEHHYDLGLFFKVRGRFAEGLAENERAAELGGAGDESCRWNLGICATGARRGEVALRVWTNMGNRLELGRFGLPEGRYQEVKVRLAERPIAERDAQHDDPGLEETIWIERLSPCHGVVRSALFQELGVDYGDVVLFDGAPITQHTYGERRVPVFPHLVTLERPGYRRFAFAGVQPEARAIASLSARLPEDAVVYAHDEQFVMMCERCWRDEEHDHASHGHAEHHVVRGKVCAPPSVSPAALRRALDDAIAATPGVHVFVPELSELAGDAPRAEVERRRMAMITSSG